MFTTVFENENGIYIYYIYITYIFHCDSTGLERGKNIGAYGTTAMGGFISMMNKNLRRWKSSAEIVAIIYIRMVKLLPYPTVTNIIIRI